MHADEALTKLSDKERQQLRLSLLLFAFTFDWTCSGKSRLESMDAVSWWMRLCGLSRFCFFTLKSGGSCLNEASIPFFCTAYLFKALFGKPFGRKNQNFIKHSMKDRDNISNIIITWIIHLPECHELLAVSSAWINHRISSEKHTKKNKQTNYLKIERLRRGSSIKSWFLKHPFHPK